MICTQPVTIKNRGMPLLVPCGKCLACRINRSREWQVRLTNHYYAQKNGYFITLTYDDEHLPKKMLFDKHKEMPCVSKTDVQKFVRKIRDTYGHTLDISYFAGSEYGELGRPHYHLLLFNLPDELVLLPSKKWKRGDPLSFSSGGSTSYCNRRLSDFWGKGFVTIGQIVPERIGYCSKYFINKQDCPYTLMKFEKKDFQNFSLMSKGLGLEYVDKIKDKVRYYNLHSLKNERGTYVKMPRYYKNKIYTEDERKEQFEQMDIAELNQRYPEDLRSIAYQYERKMTFKNKKSKL